MKTARKFQVPPWENTSFLFRVSYVLFVILLISLVPVFPFWYYTLLRLVVFIVAGGWAYRFFYQKKNSLCYLSLGIMVVFEPFYQIPGGRKTSLILNFLLILLLLWLWTREGSKSSRHI